MKTKILLLTGLLLVLLVSEAHPARDRDNLKGLQGVGVVIEEIAPDLEKDGVSEAQLQTRVELKLRQAGIRVFTRDERLKAPGYPYLYLVITSVHDPSSPAYAAYMSLQLTELVKLTHDRSMPFASATIWQQGRVALVGTKRLRMIYETVDDLMDVFVNDCLAANPK
jgi:hypothetical protein